MKKVLICALALLVAAGAAFAGGQKADSGSGSAKGGAVKMVLLIRNQNEDFLRIYSDNVQKLAKAKGVELTVLDALGDGAQQQSQLETALSQGQKYFVIIPCVPDLSDNFNKLIQAKGGAACYSNIQPTASSLKVGKTFFYASSPEAVCGNFQGDIVADYLDAHPEKAPGKAANIAIIYGQLGHPAQINREAGCLETLKKRGYTVTEVFKDTANWDAGQAQDKVTAWAASPNWAKVNFVVAQNDGMALGAIAALKSAGKLDSAPVVGADATPAALASMKAGELYATVLQDAAGQAGAAFDVVYQCATGTYKAGNPANGTPAATKTIPEAPADDAAVIGQCYLVPFVKVDKNSQYYKDNAK